MRLIPILLLLPLVAFAQQPPGQQIDQQAYYEQMKQAMLPMMDKSLPAMQETRGCVERSGNSAELNGCMEKAMAFQAEMLKMMGAPPEATAAMPETPQLEWSESLRAEILGDLDQSIESTVATRKCLTASATPDAMQACMNDAGLGGQGR